LADCELAIESMVLAICTLFQGRLLKAQALSKVRDACAEKLKSQLPSIAFSLPFAILLAFFIAPASESSASRNRARVDTRPPAPRPSSGRQPLKTIH
jgi:hypothetical protein